MSSRWRTADGVISRHLPEGVAVLALDGDEVLVVSGPGRDVWDALASRPTADEVVTALAARYHADKAQVRADVDALLDDLRDRGLVVAEPVGR